MKHGKMIKVSSIPWVVIVLAFVLLYAAYFLLYIPQQESLVEQRAFRVLKEFAGNMRDKLDYYETHMKNYSPYYSIDYLSKNEKPGFRENLELAIRNNRQVETLIANLEKTITTSECEANSNQEDIIFDKGEYQIRFGGANANEVEKVLNRFVSGNMERKKNYNRTFSFSHKLPMTTFMENLKFDQLLNNIALFNDSAVIYNTNLEVIQDITNPGLLADTVNKLQGGLIAKINIRGEDQRVMVLPFQFLGNRLFLAGFILSSDFRQKTRAINNQFLITLAGVLLLLLFGMPILKIVFISRKEPLRANDGTASNISLIFGIGFFILIILSIMKQYVVDRQILRHRITDISETLCNHVNGDFEEIKTLYHDIIDTGKQPKSNDALVKTVQNTFKEELPDPSPDSKKTAPNYIAKIPDAYMKMELPLNEVFLIGDNGLLMKIVSRTGAASLVPVDLSHRNYFKKVRMNSNDYWTYKNSYGQIQPYFIESIKSYNSGKKEVAFSFRLNETQASRFGANILAITSPLPTLYKQVLPEDVSFLIMNDQGDVLFHSDQSKNLHENFLNECDENSRLRGAMNHRVTDIIHIDYNEKNWLARIVPVKDAPLFHITLIDLGYLHNKNARILFYTFYFMIATFILILTGIGIVYLTRLSKGETQSKTWIFHWLLFRDENHRAYTFLLIVQSMLLVFQLLGLLINDKPVVMFVYQTIFVIFSAFAAFSILGNIQNGKTKKRFTLLKFPQILFFAIMVIFVIIIVCIHLKNALLYTVAAVVIMSLLLIRAAKLFLDKEKDQEKKALNAEIVYGSSSHSGNTHFRRNIFHLYVFTWLLCISAVPAIQYYRSVKSQEENLWKRDMLEYAAIRNLELGKEYTADMRNSDWYKKITGNGIDFLKINQEDNNASIVENEILKPADWFYTLLPDPVTKGNHLVGLLKNTNYHNEWRRVKEGEAINQRFDDNVLYYSQAGTEGQIRAEQCGIYHLGAPRWLLYFTLPVIIVVAFLWFLFRYVAQSVLRTKVLNDEYPGDEPWTDLFTHKGFDKILLVSLNGAEYQKKAEELFQNNTAVQNPPANAITLYADNLPEIQELADHKELRGAGLLWIKGMDELIKDPKKLEKQLPKLSALCGKMTGKLIVELPFGFDFIREYYDEFIYESAPDKQETANLRLTLQKLENLFRDFYKYTGTIEQEKHKNASKSKDCDSSCGTEETKASDYLGLETRYRYFWNNLTTHEKLVLTDLGEDGMLNYRNKQLINQLKMKGLVTYVPYPQIFSDGFRHFLLEVIDPDETRELQSNMRKQGNWHNLRYLILLILIPLIIFILIAQGTSIEKVIAFTTGGLAVLSGIIRLFESDFLKQATRVK